RRVRRARRGRARGAPGTRDRRGCECARKRIRHAPGDHDRCHRFGGPVMTFPFLVAALGCNSDATIQHPIEITGYLDPARMELTSRTQVGADETATIAVA